MLRKAKTLERVGMMLGKKEINEYGHLVIGGCDVVQLAQEFGTPLYLFDEALLRESMCLYRQSFERFYPNYAVAYASKAFICSAMCRIVFEEGLFLDVVSGGEYYIARSNDFPADRIIFHGNNKTPQERDVVLREGVGRWVVDSEAELKILAEEVKSYVHGKLPLLFRLTPGIDPHTHHYITTGKIDSKFGLPIVEGVARKVMEKALALPQFEVKGVHCHIGSQIDSLEPFLKACEVMLEFMFQFWKETGFLLEELDLGGGLGVPYLDEQKDQFPSIEQYVEAITTRVREWCGEHSFPLPRLIVEPGRSIVNTAGNTVYRVGIIKEIPGIKKYVVVDGGMTDNPRPVLYDARYQALVANRMLDERREKVSVVGKCCESGDVIIPEIELPRLLTGDILVIEGTGAYNHTMASNYNMIPRPGVVFVKEGKAELVVRPESLSDLIRRDILPEN